MAAISEQEEFEFRRRAEAEAQAAAKPKPKEATFLSTVGRGLWNAPMDLAETVKAGMQQFGPEGLPARAIMHPVKTTQAMGQMLGNVWDTGKGMVQQARDMSAPEFRGSAPRMDTAPAQKFEAGLTKQNLYRTLGDHPVGVLAALAPVAGPAVKASRMGEMLSGAGSMASRANPVPAIARVLDAGATPAAENVRAAALAKVLAQKQALTDAETTAAARKSADPALRAKMEQAADAQAARGVGVSDMPQAQSLVAELSGRLNPNGPVATTPTTAQATAYKHIIDTLAPSKGPKPSLEMVQNLRRELADAAYGGADPQGLGAISKIDKRNLVQRLHEIEDAYTGGASTPVRENYAAAMTAQEKADELGKLRDTLTTNAAQLDELPPQKAAAQARTIVTSLAKKGLVSEAEYREFLQLANAATDAKGKSAFRKRLALFGAASLGVSAGGAAVGGHAAGILP